MTLSTGDFPPLIVGPFCRKGLRDLSRPSTKHRLIGGQRGGVERTFARGFELCSKVLLGKEDLLKTLQLSQIRVAVLQHVDFIIAEHRQLTTIFAKVGLF